MRFEQIAKGIFQLKVPFEDLYTSVFAVIHEGQLALIDTATTPYDVDTYIFPALTELVEREGGELSCILLTHRHSDHAGGAPRLRERFPHVPICGLRPTELSDFRLLHDGELLLGCLRVLHLPGHATDAAGYLDTRHGLLLSGDCLQLRGVGKYTNGIRDREAYVASIERLEGMKISAIIASHDYVPLGAVAEGYEKVAEYLAECKRIAWES